MAGRVYDPDGLAPALGASHFQQVKYIVDCKNMNEEKTLEIKQATSKGYTECVVGGVADLEYPNSLTRRGRVIDRGKVCPTLTTASIPSVLEEWTWEVDGELYLIRIRKLTPRECGRLMGVSDTDITKILECNSNTQAYKQFGNSIVVDVMENIFRLMLPDWSNYINPPIEEGE